MTLEFLRDLRNRLRQATSEESLFMYLLQRLSGVWYSRVLALLLAGDTG